MMMFHIGVLTSVTFWAIYFVLTLVVCSIGLKHVAPLTFAYIIDEGYFSRYDKPEYWIVIILWLLFWPIITIALLVWFGICKGFGIGLRGLLK